jgi:hypothetical protein
MGVMTKTQQSTLSRPQEILADFSASLRPSDGYRYAALMIMIHASHYE